MLLEIKFKNIGNLKGKTNKIIITLKLSWSYFKIIIIIIINWKKLFFNNYC